MGDLNCPKDVPAAFRAVVDGYVWLPVTVGRSTARTWRLERRNSPSLYIKMNMASPGSAPDEIEHERAVMEWLGGRLAAARVVASATASGERWLLVTAVPGEMAHEVADRGAVVSLVARKLRDIHALDPETCPFDRGLETMLRIARFAMDHGLVDTADFDRERRGLSAGSVWDDLVRSKPLSEDPVFCHGDYCLPNVLITGRMVTGVVDWGRAGVSDRYRDLGIASRSIKDNFGEEYEPLFFEAYGVKDVDYDKVRFYRLLDEFF